MENEIPEGNEREMAPTDVEWKNRILCSDGNCIGVIGPDGRCKECGKEYEGKLPEEYASAKEEPPPTDISSEKEDPAPEDLDVAAESDEKDESMADDDWQDRVLCSDGNCIGVIGPDGNCKECGKPYVENSD